jgi:hypothetical protein
MDLVRCWPIYLSSTERNLVLDPLNLVIKYRILRDGEDPLYPVLP